VDLDAIGVGIDPRAQLGDDLAVDAHSALPDHLLGRAPRSDAGAGEEFLEPHRTGHVAPRAAGQACPASAGTALLAGPPSASGLAVPGHGPALPEHDGQLFRPRQVLEGAEPEMLEEPGRRAVEHRPSEPITPPDGRDELPFLERAQHAGRTDAADLLDLRAPD